MLLYHTADLLWASRLAAAARAAGVQSASIADAPAARDALVRVEQAGVLALIDLTSPRALEVIRALRESSHKACAGRVRLVAFGPHVDRAALRAARDAGADDALPRGALANRLEAMLAETADRSQPP